MTPDELDQQITELSTRIERLRALYEQYFMGIERMEPAVARKDVERRVQELRKTRFPTTAKRFKFQTLIQRYNTLQQYWGRTCREIENGTYRKHRIKAARRFGESSARKDKQEDQEKEALDQGENAERVKKEATADLEALLDIDVDLDAEFKEVVKKLESLPPSPIHSKLAPSPKPKGLSGLSPQASASRGSPKPGALKPLKGRKISAFPKPGPSIDVQAPAPAKLPALGKSTLNKADPATGIQNPKQTPAPSPVQKIPEGLSDQRILALHRSYSDARKKTNAKSVSLEKLSKSIRDTEQKLRSRNGGRSVEFDVKIKDGKAIIKPKLK